MLDSPEEPEKLKDEEESLSLWKRFKNLFPCLRHGIDYRNNTLMTCSLH